jgi:AcrR family transcriptional regulator
MKDKEKTKKKMIEAVASIFKTEGHAGLGVNRVARMAGVNKKLIYRYFGTFDNLIEQYVTETDYWMRFIDHIGEIKSANDLAGVQKLIEDILKNQFLYFYSDKEMQNLMLWELTTKSTLMQSIHRTREIMGQRLLELTDPYFAESTINFRAVAALLVGGIYYTILHTRHNGGMFSDVDLASEKGKADILVAIDHIVSSTFQNAEPDDKGQF